MQYNVKYLEERRRLREQLARKDGFYIGLDKQPELAFNEITPEGQFTVAFDESIVGLTFISDLDEKIIASGDTSQLRELTTNNTKRSG